MTYRSGTFVGAQVGSQITFPVPAGIVNGDALLIQVEKSSNAGPPTCPGFQLLGQSYEAGGWAVWTWVLCKVALNEPAQWTVNLIDNSWFMVTAVVHSGLDPNDPFGTPVVTNGSAYSVAHTVPSLTLGGRDAVLFFGSENTNGPATHTAPTGWTNRVAVAGSASGVFLAAFVADKTFGSSGPTGTSTVTTSAPVYGKLLVVELIPPLTGTIASATSTLTANLLKPGELGGTVRSVTTALSTEMQTASMFDGAIRPTDSELSAVMTGIPLLDFTAYDAYIDDNTTVVGYIFHDTDNTRAADQSLRLQPVRQDVGNNPAEVRPESGDLFAQTDFSHGDGQEYFHHTGRDPRRFLHSEGYDISIAGKLNHLHRMVLANPASSITDVVVAAGRPFYADGTSLFIGDGLFPSAWSSDDWDAGESRTTITSLASSGSDLYLAAGSNGIHKRSAAGAWTHYVNDTAGLGFSKVAWVKDRLIAVSGTAIYEITASGALPAAIETLAPGWVATAIFASGGFIYVCWVNTNGGLSQISHYGLNSGATAIEKKGSTPLPQGQFAMGGNAYLNTIFIGVGRLNSDGGYDPVLYQGVADTTGIVDYVKVVEEKGSGSVDLSVSAIEPFGEAVLYGWSLRAGASTAAAREGLGIFHLGLAAHAHHFATGNASSRKVTSIVIYKGRVLFAVQGVGLYYEDPTTFVALAEMIPSVADYSNAGIKVWDRLEVSHRPLVAGTSVALDYTTSHPDDNDWHGAIISNTPDSEGAESTLSTATSRLFDVRLRSTAGTPQTVAPEVLGFAVRSNPAPTVPEYQLSRTVRLFASDRKDDKGELVYQNPDDMREHLQSLAYRWVKVYEPDATWTARVESVATLEPMQPMERVTAGEPERSGYVMQLVLSGTRD